MRLPNIKIVVAALAVLAGLILAVPSVTAQDTRTIDVRFPRGQSGATLSDSLSGYQIIDYKLGLSAGQNMSVQLDSDNRFNFFNITAPGASTALFAGDVSGTSANVTLPVSGNYTIRVYLMRNAARRGESANFDLTVYVAGNSQAVVRPAPVQNDFADGLEGGPDFWQVHGLAGGDTLNVRSGPSTGNGVVGRLYEGDVVRNQGCRMNGSTRWCFVAANSGLTGWVAGRFLHESFSQAPAQPTTLPSVIRPTLVPAETRPPNQTSGTIVSRQDMPRYCKGEASAKFDRRPNEIVTNLSMQAGGLYISQGWFDHDDTTTFFTCYFQLDGSFIAVN